jgi:hypothetical protein
MLITPSSAQSSSLFLTSHSSLALIRSASEVTVTLSKPWRLSPCEGIKGTGETCHPTNFLPRRNILYYYLYSRTSFLFNCMATPPSCHQLLLGRSDSIIPCPATSNHTTSIAKKILHIAQQNQSKQSNMVCTPIILHHDSIL